MALVDVSALPDDAPVPNSALGPAVNEQGDSVGRVERNLSGHLGRLGTRDDVKLHRQYIADISEQARAAVKGYLDEVSNTAAAPIIEKYTGVLAAGDVFTAHTTFWLMESIRLDLGVGSQVHP